MELIRWSNGMHLFQNQTILKFDVVLQGIITVTSLMGRDFMSGQERLVLSSIAQGFLTSRSRCITGGPQSQRCGLISFKN